MAWPSFFAPSRVRNARQTTPRRRALEVEALEQREMLTASIPPWLTPPSVIQTQPVVPAISTLTPQVVSTVPSNGDVNPYGIAVVPSSFQGKGVLQPGDMLISNFNNAQNLQGTGTTILRIGAGGKTSTFFQGDNSLGLTAGLAVLKSGFVIVGSMPTTDGTSATVQPGSLLVLDANGTLVTTITSSVLIDGPWDLTVNDQGSNVQVFVSNVLAGTVSRIDMTFAGGMPDIVDEVRIASGYGHRGDPAALEIGPGGLVYNASTDTLYVASGLDNAVYAVSHAGTRFNSGGKGALIFQDAMHLHGPLGLAMAPNGDLITANSDAFNVDPNQPSELVEFTQKGKFVGQFSVDPNNGGAFNVNIQSNGGQLQVAAVDDNASTVKIWSLTGLVTRLAAVTPQTISTVPSNGDTNPYGVAFVPQNYHGHGVLQPGDTLVANFNNSGGMQGTGSTIVRISANGQTSTFFQGQSGMGLTAGLAVLSSGFVVVGNMPTMDGTSATVQKGSLLILDANGNVVTTFTNSALINGPWDLTVNDLGSSFQIFVANVLSGTVSRLDVGIARGKPFLIDAVQIASGYGHRGDPAALEIGPAGLAFNAQTQTLYVASSLDNAIYAINRAGSRFTDGGKGTLIYQDPVHLHGPLGLVLAPSGDLITANYDALNVDPNQPSELVELTPTGQYVGEFSIDGANAGSFNLAVRISGGHVQVAAVDDNTNSLEVWTL
jgi:sugar lactone lactonase YvrE